MGFINRKSTFAVWFLLVGLSAMGQSQTWIVDNNLKSPQGTHIRASIQEAIDAASAGDTIIVKGSPVAYANATVNKQLTLIGDGFKGNSSKVATLTLTMDASSSKIYGMHISTRLSVSGGGTGTSITLQDVDIAYNYIKDILGSGGSSNDSLQNIIIRSNIIGSGLASGQSIYFWNQIKTGGITIDNNIIYGSSSSAVRVYKANIYRNVFVGTGTELGFNEIANCSITDNIFYGRSAEAFEVATSNDNVFTGNISFSTANDSLNTIFDPDPAIGIGTDGGGNQPIDPEFTTLVLSSAWDLDNYTLEYSATSPAASGFVGPNPGTFTLTGKWLPFINSIIGSNEVIQGSTLTLNITAEIHNGIHDVPSLTAMEYFIDGNDPGLGLATDALISSTGNTFDGPVTLNTAVLEPGLHTVYVRVRDDIRWGHYMRYTVYVIESSTPSEVAAMEYFYDDDPGFGLGTAIPVTQSASVDLTDTIAASHLSQGFHKLYVRVQDQNGQWSHTNSSMVYVDLSSPGVPSLVSNIEYFFDTDPGYGAGTIVPVPTAASSIDQLIDTVSTLGLAPGFHNFFIRVQDDGGTWGLPTSNLVYLDGTGAHVVDQIEKIEYFFDADPGYGAGTAIIPEPNDTLNLMEIIPTTSLSLGFHNLFIRIQDAGGTWSLPISKLVYLDEAGLVEVSAIDSAEYFFDTDPGYGAATAIPLNASTSIDSVLSLDASSLSLGFHNLYIRVKNDGGNWGLPQSSLVYIDKSSTAQVDLTELEYFIDADPGYGNGISLPVSPSSFEKIFSDIAIAPGTISDGTHYLTVRAKNADGVWGLGESFPFVSYNNSRELDSVSLLVFHKSLSGPEWSNGFSWGQSSMENWYGVKLVNGRVDSLGLVANGLSGKVPFQLGYLSELRKLDLSENAITDTIPEDLLNLAKLEELLLNDNSIHKLPDFSQLNSLNTLSLDSNLLDFGDLEPLVGIPTLTYSNQKLYNDYPVDTIVAIGQEILIDEEVGGLENVYEWRLNGAPVPFGDFVDHPIASFAASDTGSYKLHVTNSLITDLELVSEPYRLRISDFEEDSLAMVSLYTALGGETWLNKTNWLTGTFNSWAGLAVENNRVTAIALPENNLSGRLPDDLYYADSLITIDLSGNAIQDTVPTTWTKFSQLESANLANNDLKSIPALNNLSLLNTLDVSGNALQFGDLEKNLGIPSFSYLNQDSISTHQDTLLDTNVKAVLSFTVTGSNNTYQWYKDEEPIAGATLKALTIESVQLEDEGKYRLEINNNLVSGLTLTSGLFNFGVTSLKRDSTALRRLYEATGGDNWINKTNWLSSDVGSWQGVVLNNAETRVVNLNLPDNNLTNSIPAKIRDITSMESIDVSGNELTSMVNLSLMPKLAHLDVSDNRMGFAEIKVNLGIDNFIYSPQKKTGAPEEVKIAHGSSYEKTVTVSGQNNQYKWLLNGNIVPEANSETFILDSITYETMGKYEAEVTNPDVAGLTIRSEPATVLATADFHVTSYGLNNEQIQSGTGYLLKIKSAGPFDSTATVAPVMGEFVFDDIVLGDYLVALEASDTETYLPTYFKNTFLWAEADTLQLRENGSATINMTLQPGVRDLGDGKVYGLVEAEFKEETEGDGRVSARRKVKKAGCSMRRRTRGGGGRTEEDTWTLIAYVETNDEGQFEFEDIPAGYYRFNIEYPGIPMDPNSFVEFEIGEGGVENNTFILEAFITETGIEVVKIKELGFHRKYFKNLQVYPVPANDFLNIKYEKLLSESVEMRILDLSGNTLYKQAMERGYTKGLQLDVSGYKDGYYLLHFVDKEKNSKSVMVYKLFIHHK